MIIELVFCLIHTPPGCNWVFEADQHGGTVKYPLNTFVSIIMLGRIYLIWRIFANYSSWNSESSEAICNKCLGVGDVNFAIKAELKDRPYTVVIVVMFISIFAFRLALRTAERPFKKVSH